VSLLVHVGPTHGLDVAQNYGSQLSDLTGANAIMLAYAAAFGGAANFSTAALVRYLQSTVI
jgi:hypothetical protein